MEVRNRLLRRALLAGIVILVSAWPSTAVPRPGTVTSSKHPLVARYTLDLPAGARMRVAFGPHGSYGRHTAWLTSKGGETTVLVAGMRATSDYHMRAEIEQADGSRWVDADHVFRTGEPPRGRVPVVRAWRPVGDTPMAGGVEVLSLVAYDKSNLALNAVVTDLEGHLLWYYDHESIAIPHPLRLLDNGHFLVVLVKYLTPSPDAVMLEVDLEGTVVRKLTTDTLNERLAAAGFKLKAHEMHHELLPLPNGHVLMLVDTWRTVAGPRGDVKALGDAVVDLDPSWRPVWVWDAFDHLDKTYHPWGMEDWTHANAIVHDPRDGSLLVSMRHFNQVIKIDYRHGRGDGAVLWRLGHGGDFRLVRGHAADWFFAQHLPVIAPTSTPAITDMTIFDNGNFRVLDPRGTTAVSRVVKVRYDERQKTAEVIWEKRLPWFSDAAGGVCLLPDGHLEYAAGWLPLGGHIGELDADMKEIWSMETRGQKIYRAERIPSLYPGVTW